MKTLVLESDNVMTLYAIYYRFNYENYGRCCRAASWFVRATSENKPDDLARRKLIVAITRENDTDLTYCSGSLCAEYSEYRPVFLRGLIRLYSSTRAEIFFFSNGISRGPFFLKGVDHSKKNKKKRLEFME